MTRVSIRLLQAQPLRTALTVSGIALCVVLMLFLLAVHRGVEVGSIEYIRAAGADLWVLQGGVTNILRGSSLLSSGHGKLLEEVSGVRSAAPVLFVLTTLKKGNRQGTVYLTGYAPPSHRGGPPALIGGRHVERNGEIVIDRSYSAKHRVVVGDRVSLRDDSLTVVGISDGTNMFVLQYAFVSLGQARDLIGYPGIVSCYLLEVEDGAFPEEVAERIREDIPGVEVFTHKKFLTNNVREMESGFLPLLYTIAMIGAVVLTTLLTLILSINILERRRDLAVLKTLGASEGALLRLLLSQGLQFAALGLALAFPLFFPMREGIEWITPEVAAMTSVEHVGAVVTAVCVMGVVSSLISFRRIRRIYPLEAFA